MECTLWLVYNYHKYKAPKLYHGQTIDSSFHNT